MNKFTRGTLGTAVAAFTFIAAAQSAGARAAASAANGTEAGSFSSAPRANTGKSVGSIARGGLLDDKNNDVVGRHRGQAHSAASSPGSTTRNASPGGHAGAARASAVPAITGTADATGASTIGVGGAATKRGGGTAGSSVSGGASGSATDSAARAAFGSGSSAGASGGSGSRSSGSDVLGPAGGAIITK